MAPHTYAVGAACPLPSICTAKCPLLQEASLSPQVMESLY